MNVSEKVDAEFINSATFKITEKLYNKENLYKIGMLLLSGDNSELEEKIRFVDSLSGRIDLYIMKNEMKKALVFTVLLRKKVNSIIDLIHKKEIDLVVAS